jgi:hypothetical protein
VRLRARLSARFGVLRLSVHRLSVLRLNERHAADEFCNALLAWEAAELGE